MDDAIEFTRPWNFDAGGIQVPISIWYGPDDALCPRAHTDWLLQHIPEAEARELPGGHVLDKPSLYRPLHVANIRSVDGAALLTWAYAF